MRRGVRGFGNDTRFTLDLATMSLARQATHLPVVVDGQLVGIVSIGDVVKARLTQLEEESRQMQDYITTGR